MLTGNRCNFEGGFVKAEPGPQPRVKHLLDIDCSRIKFEKRLI